MANGTWRKVAGFLAAACVGFAAIAQTGSTPAIDHALAKRYFAEAVEISRADAGSLWGIPLAGPLLFADPRSKYVVANQADAEGKLVASGGVWVGTLPPEIGVANTAIKFGGTHWTMIAWKLPERRTDRRLLMAHEMFHRVQDGLGLPGASPPNAHLDTRDGRLWLRMEWRALGEALVRDGEARKAAIADALAFRAKRREACGGPSATQENELELNEGLCEYTGFRLCGLPSPALAYRARTQMERHEDRGGFTRSFAYASGPAYGLLLDSVKPGWNIGFKAPGDLGELLGRLAGVKPSMDVESAMARYDGADVRADEDRREARRVAQLREDKARYIDGTVLVLPAGELRYSFDPNGVRAFDETSSVFTPATVSDSWGVLEAGGGAMMVRDASGGIVAVRVPGPKDHKANPLEGDGWSLKVADGWEVVSGSKAGELTLKKK